MQGPADSGMRRDARAIAGAEAATRQAEPACTKRPCTTPASATWRWAPPFAPAAGQARSQNNSLSPLVPAVLEKWEI